MESIADNQTYVDDMKEVFGKQQPFFDNFKETMGEDWKWWFFPTRPLLRINYLEKLYKVKELYKI